MTLPEGFVVTLDRDTRVLDGGRALLGGSPVRLLRLTERAHPLLTGRTVEVRDPAGAVLADRLLESGLAHPVVDVLPSPDDPRYTFVVPVRDRPRPLDRLLTSIGRDHPVIVVDDASRRRGPVEAVAARHGARFVPLDVNLGPAGARNAGLRLVTTPYVVFVDSDVVLPPGAIPTLLRHFTDPRVAMAVPRITGLPHPASTGWIARYEDARSSLDLGPRPAQVRPGTSVSWASTACTVARTDALPGGFDERMRVGEDVDLGWRVVKNGRRIRYEPSVHAAHEHRVRFDDWFVRKAVYGTGAHPLAERHPEFIAPAVLAPWGAAFVLALLAQRRWSVPVAGAVCAVTAARITRKLRGTEHPARLASSLTAMGAIGALSQTSALLTRHWWPVTAVGCAVSRRVRRAAALAAVTDVALEYWRARPDIDPVRYGVARRLDDLAYGSGVWWSAVRGRSTVSLRPRVTHARTEPGSAGVRT
ncbi:mycofactocin biosynthesis glycosyltransferase MftF [Streptomyces sp. NBC_01235]|uniref:mycofactocin biosynthesis glycosyltransferase MftF n=1 Tax=Streptomyces sp. NBC_01235 TaxID=2903788 RepID=UPI002E1156E8|nr:mycofactocin biosynthesis glycosyltransferase MftF [Streptomyces sp. NBC_01235]WSP86142.1 mycofactocin biosynthesis glycosyltransferase MftF [Streptomyces sp. NBC_01235]